MATCCGNCCSRAPTHQAVTAVLAGLSHTQSAAVSNVLQSARMALCCQHPSPKPHGRIMAQYNQHSSPKPHVTSKPN